MGKPPGAGGTAIDCCVSGQPKVSEKLGQAKLEEAKFRKAGEASKERKGPIVTFRGALGAGAIPQRNRWARYLSKRALADTDKELRWREGRKT